ncbi:MAG: PAS domain S-box protein [Candidatus Acidiferrales bacterium]
MKTSTTELPKKEIPGVSPLTSAPAKQRVKGPKMRYRALLEWAPDGIVVVNQFGSIILVNAQTETLFGYRRAELIGKSAEILISEHSRGQHKEQHSRFLAAPAERPAVAGVELFGLRKDGSEFPVEIRLSPLVTKEGILISSAIRDISDRRRTEEDLRRLAMIVSCSDDAILGKTMEGIITSWNASAERIYGYSAEETIGKPVSMLAPADRPDEISQMLERLKCGETVDHFETVRVRKDGQEIQIELTISPIRDALNRIVGASTIGRDITARKANEAELLRKMEELSRSNEEWKQFATIAADDLQEPLRMMIGYLQLISARYKGKLDSEADEFIAFATDGASRMQRLIHDLLVYTRIGTRGKEPLDTSSEKALEEALLNLHSILKESGALVTHDPLPIIAADEIQLIQLFENLIGNAIKFHGDGIPRVHISAARNDGRKWVFSFTDNGLGIDPQNFKKIFGLFQRLQRREEYPGTGIGLAICKKIVERHGGNISVESQPGKGSTFRFDLAGDKAKS